MSSVATKNRTNGSHPINRNAYSPLCENCSQRTKNESPEEEKYLQKCGKCDGAMESSTDKGKENGEQDNDDGNNEIESGFPEGGWGWVVVTASFFNSFIFDGIGSSFGVLYPYVHDKFQASAFVTSFAGSIFGAYLIMGSVAALLIKKFGFRAVSFSGGLMSCIAFVLASQSSNIYLFLLAYGVIGGASIGLVYLPSMVIVNGYFNKRRGITNGIISSGSGMGLLVMAPIINALLDYYSLGGAVLILGGVLLNICVFSSCFRQPVVYSSSSATKEGARLLNNESPSEDDTEESALDNGLECVQQSNEKKDLYIDFNEQISKVIDSNVSKQEVESSYPSLVITPEAECQMGENTRGKFKFKLGDNFLFRELSTNHSQSASKLNIVKRTDDNSWMRSLNRLPAKNEAEINIRKYPSQHSTRVLTDIGANSYLTGSISQLMHVHNQHFSSSNQLHTTTSHQMCRSSSTIPTNVVGQVCKDNSKEMGGFDQGIHLALADSSHNNLSTSDNTSCSVEVIPETLGYSLSQLLRMVSFYLFCLGACLIQLGYPVPNIFLSDLAAKHGIPHRHGALMISLIGSFNIIGRLLGGALANLNFNPIQVNDLAMLLAAVLCFLCPLFTSLWSLCLFSAMYGFLLGLRVKNRRRLHWGRQSRQL